MPILTKQDVVFLGNDTFLPDMRDFDLPQTLDCGQAFRWELSPDGGFSGVVREKICHISQKDDGILLEGVSQRDFEQVWRDYFDIDRDYAEIKAVISSDPVLERAARFAPGIRILRQDAWEALCSFIISQNNNVSRIKGIVGRLCESFGKPLGGGMYSFPPPEALAALTPDDLSPLRAGFRARYIIDAAQKVASGEVSLPALRELPIPEARAELMRIVGVGIKVADCALLFGCGRIECFPVDVWIKRVMEALLPDGLPECAVPFAGIAQQYLFHYARTSGIFKEKEKKS